MGSQLPDSVATPKRAWVQMLGNAMRDLGDLGVGLLGFLVCFVAYMSTDLHQTWTWALPIFSPYILVVALAGGVRLFQSQPARNASFVTAVVTVLPGAVISLVAMVFRVQGEGLLLYLGLQVYLLLFSLLTFLSMWSAFWFRSVMQARA